VWRKTGVQLGLFALVLVLIVVGFQVYGAITSRHALAALRGTPFLPERDAPDVTLVDQRGTSAPLVDSRFAATFVFFGFTHCKDTCPATLARLAKAYRSLPNAAKVRVEMVTVDPARDNPATLRRFVAQFDPRFVGLTAKKSLLEPLWSDFDVVVNAKTNDVAHGDAIYLVDQRRHVLTIYPPDVSPADLAHDARVLSGD